MKIKSSPENFLEWMAMRLNLAPIPLIDTQISFIVARAIMAAADTGIFEALGKEKKTYQQVAEMSKNNEVATKHLLDCLVGVGYVKWKKGWYTLNPKYYKWLLAEYPSNLLGKLRFQLYEWNIFNHLEDYIRNGKSLNLHAELSPEVWASYQEGMRDISINAAEESSKKINLGASPQKMLDIGGSHGLYSVELCKKYPSLSSTILELSGAIERASQISGTYGLGDRIQYKDGNALKDELGEQVYDLIMINNLVHHFTVEENILLAKKAAKALKPGGLYIVGESIRQQNPGEGGTVASAIGLQFALTSSSGTWSVDEINSWQQEAGLKIQKPISLMTMPGFKMVAARKEG